MFRALDVGLGHTREVQGVHSLTAAFGDGADRQSLFFMLGRTTGYGQLRKFTPVAQFARKRSSGSRYRAKQVKIAERGDN
jgi:hypothetical protein